jgi:hypothetical protein
MRTASCPRRVVVIATVHALRTISVEGARGDHWVAFRKWRGAKICGASGVLVLRDGTNSTISNGYVTSIRDRNGNLTSFTTSSITDPLGRIYSISPTQIRYTGASSGQRTITIKRVLLDQVLVSGESIETLRTALAGYSEFHGFESNGQIRSKRQNVGDRLTGWIEVFIPLSFLRGRCADHFANRRDRAI